LSDDNVCCSVHASTGEPETANQLVGHSAGSLGFSVVQT
jgi:hypothetical protein